MGSPDIFSVDLDELNAVIADVEQTEQSLEAITNDLERQIRALQEVWEGLAAEAQLAAQATWEEGMRDMRAALADLRAAAKAAHGNYTAGARANLDMWESLA